MERRQKWAKVLDRPIVEWSIICAGVLLMIRHSLAGSYPPMPPYPPYPPYPPQSPVTPPVAPVTSTEIVPSSRLDGDNNGSQEGR